MATSVGGKLLAGNSNSVKVSNENGEPVAEVEEKEDEWEDSLAHRLNLNNNYILIGNYMCNAIRFI